MGFPALLLLAAAVAPSAMVKVKATILSPARVPQAGVSTPNALMTTTRTLRDPATGAPLRVTEFQ